MKKIIEVKVRWLQLQKNRTYDEVVDTSVSGTLKVFTHSTLESGIHNKRHKHLCLRTYKVCFTAIHRLFPTSRQQ